MSGTVARQRVGHVHRSRRPSARPAGVDPTAGPNNTASDTDPVIRGEADLAVSITDGPATVAAGRPVTYTIVAAQPGPDGRRAARAVAAPLPARLQGVTWTCAASGGAACTPAGLRDDRATPVDTAGGRQVTYTLHAHGRPAGRERHADRDGGVAAPSDIRRSVAANNAATDSDPLAGDAPPVPNPQSVTVVEDGAVGITLTASDPDGDPLTLAIATRPAHGVLTGTRPEPDLHAARRLLRARRFTFSAYDGILSARSRTVSITVSPVNDPPQASGSRSHQRGRAAAITLGASDADGDALVYTIVTPPRWAR